jgi:hypothetical protein
MDGESEINVALRWMVQGFLKGAEQARVSGKLRVMERSSPRTLCHALVIIRDLDRGREGVQQGLEVDNMMRRQSDGLQNRVQDPTKDQLVGEPSTISFPQLLVTGKFLAIHVTTWLADLEGIIDGANEGALDLAVPHGVALHQIEEVINADIICGHGCCSKV